MTAYKITIKDNSIPEHMQKAIPNFHNEYTAIIKANKFYTWGKMILLDKIDTYMRDMAQELDTDPESLEILSIIKQ